MKKETIKKIAAIVMVLLLCGGLLFVLQKSAQNGRKTTSFTPQVSGDPIYVECEKGKSLDVYICPTETFSSSGIRILLVNITDESRGTLQVCIQDAKQNVLANEMIPVNTVTPGEWLVIEAQLDYQQGEEYQISFLPDNSEPYFMKIENMDTQELPFVERVVQNGNELTCGISFGIDKVEPVNLTFGDIFYFSRWFCVIATVVAILWIWFGIETLKGAISKVPLNRIVEKYGNDIFLLMVFLYLSITILSRAYLKGAYISADSAGYLREAINIVAGNGFSYDGLSGYQTWFANWPILYPAMIAGIMAITGLNAYLASKIVALFVIALILLVFRFVFKKDAWLYSLCLFNIGFITLCCYTWSEVPFMLFLLVFTLLLAKLVSNSDSGIVTYVLFGLSGIACFMTRYFGIYIWLVTGCYLLGMFLQFMKSKDPKQLRRMVGITITSFISGCICVGYLFVNKLMNGMPSGVSRSIWWDDYEILTNDLIQSLLTEFTNAFSVQIPQIIDGLTFEMKVFILLLILCGLLLFLKNRWKPFTRESVMITMGTFYYLIFIAIRYRSSMDSFYFRFFEPASFLICIGLIGFILPDVRKKAGSRFLAASVIVIMITTVISMGQTGSLNTKQLYYQELTAGWDKLYQEIPQKSVVIFNDIDFRSQYYRPDVVTGLITPDDSMETLKDTYYGSDYLCIKREFAQTMLESGEYQDSINHMLQVTMEQTDGKQAYLVFPLNIKK